MHNGFLNNYSFVKDGKGITLTSLAPHQMPKAKSSKPIGPTEKLPTLMEADLKASQHEFRLFKS